MNSSNAQSNDMDKDETTGYKPSIFNKYTNLNPNPNPELNPMINKQAQFNNPQKYENHELDSFSSLNSDKNSAQTNQNSLNEQNQQSQKKGETNPEIKNEFSVFGNSNNQGDSPPEQNKINQNIPNIQNEQSQQNSNVNQMGEYNRGMSIVLESNSNPMIGNKNDAKLNEQNNMSNAGQNNQNIFMNNSNINPNDQNLNIPLNSNKFKNADSNNNDSNKNNNSININQMNNNNQINNPNNNPQMIMNNPMMNNPKDNSQQNNPMNINNPMSMSNPKDMNKQMNMNNPVDMSNSMNKNNQMLNNMPNNMMNPLQNPFINSQMNMSNDNNNNNQMNMSNNSNNNNQMNMPFNSNNNNNQMNMPFNSNNNPNNQMNNYQMSQINNNNNINPNLNNQMPNMNMNKNNNNSNKLMPETKSILEGSNKNNNNNINSNNNQNIPNKPQEQNPNEPYSFSRYKEASLTTLKNLGDTSYLNSVLQLLGTSRALSNYFINPKNTKYFVDNMNSAPLAFVLHRLFTHFYPYPKKDKPEVYEPETLLTILGSKNKIYASTERRNPNDLILFILNYLHKEINFIKTQYITSDSYIDKQKAIHEFIENYNRSNKSIISINFIWFEIKSQKCTQCNTEFYSLRNYETLDLDLSNFYTRNYNQALTITKCLEFQRNKQQKSFCKKCGEYNMMMNITNGILSLPSYLVFSLNRESSSTNINLLSVPFLVEEIIDLSNYIEIKDSFSAYELQGIVSICISQNKYVCFGKSPVDHKWYLYNDDKYYNGDINTVLNLNNNNKGFIPCILLYKAISKAK